MKDSDLAYLAGVLDMAGLITTRRTQDGTLLPAVALSTGDTRLLSWLGEITGMRPIATRRSYTKAGCGKHCPDKHQNVESLSGRWSISGAKATIVLDAIKPHLRLKRDEAQVAISTGLAAPFKQATPVKMVELGWPLPEEWRDRYSSEQARTTDKALAREARSSGGTPT